MVAIVLLRHHLICVLVLVCIFYFQPCLLAGALRLAASQWSHPLSFPTPPPPPTIHPVIEAQRPDEPTNYLRLGHKLILFLADI